jgi:hypothetical protein
MEAAAAAAAPSSSGRGGTTAAEGAQLEDVERKQGLS